MTTTSEGRRRHGISAIAASATVLCVALGFYGYASTLGRGVSAPRYELRATFLSSNGLRQGGDVILAGVPVGSVTSISLDEHTMLSDVSFRIDQALKLPVDTKLAIGSATLTSGNALLVTPGKSSRMLSPGATLTDTCELTSLEQQVSQYIFGNGGASSGCGSDSR